MLWPRPWFVVAVAISWFGLENVSRSADAPAKKRTWTFLLYMAADNDLEAPIMDNVEELMQVGGNQNVNVIALVDRSTKQSAEEKEAAEGNADKADEDNDNGNAEEEEEEEDLSGYTNRDVGDMVGWEGAKLIRIETDHLKELADWGEVNMGDPATLKRFIEEVVADYPAERYGLLLNDHGGGWSGICVDESGDDDQLSLIELQTVLSNASRKTGKFEFLGFDACLMGNFEVMAALAPFARVIIASEELVPGDGWNYVPILRTLEKHPQSTGLEVGEVMADAFRDYFSKADRARGERVTLSVVDTDKIPALEKALNHLAAAVDHALRHGGNASWLKVARARSRTVEFGKSVDSDTGSDLFDLIHFATLAKSNLPDAKTVAAADETIAAVKAAVVHNVRGKARPHSNGLSIFFPNDADILKGDDNSRYADLDIAARGHWAGMLGTYCDLAGRQQLTPMLREVKATGLIAAPDRVLQMRTRVISDDLDQIALVIGQPTPQGLRFLGQVEVFADEDGLVDEEVNDSWYTVSSKRGEFYCPIMRWRTIPEESANEENEKSEDDQNQDADSNEENEEEQTEGKQYAETPVQLRRAGHEGWTNVTLGFYIDPDADGTDGELSYVYMQDSRGFRQIELNKGDHIRPLATVLLPSGKLRQAPMEEHVLKVDRVQSLRMKAKEFPPGKYQAGFLATNLAGDVETEFLEITIQP